MLRLDPGQLVTAECTTLTMESLLANRPPANGIEASGIAARRPNRQWSRLPGTSPAVSRVEDSIARAAQFDCPVLITGETGCGKEEIARAIHAASTRATKPFVSVNCGGLVSTLAESQLFGHEKGSFTGAVGQSLGAFRAADGGVVFLDEIGEMPLDLQPKLLHVLQQLEVTPVGSNRSHSVDVQVIAATNRDVEAAVEAGDFREDLFYRLNTIHIRVPALRDRGADIPLFIEYFSSHFAQRYGRRCWRPSPALLERLIAHPWPGNVRQLVQTIQRLYVFEGSEETVLAELLGGEFATPNVVAEAEPEPVACPAVQDPVADAEPEVPLLNLVALRRLAVRQAMRLTNGHRGQAAELLGVSLNTMTRLATESCPELPTTKAGRKPANRPR